MRGSRAASSDMSAWCSAVVLLSLILLLSVRENNASASVRGSQFSEKPCEEIYVVGEGETLHTIGDKCGDPFIVERNPHIHDPDDVFPGLILRIAPFYFSRKLLGFLDCVVKSYKARNNLEPPWDEIRGSEQWLVIKSGYTSFLSTDKCMPSD